MIWVRLAIAMKFGLKALSHWKQITELSYNEENKHGTGDTVVSKGWYNIATGSVTTCEPRCVAGCVDVLANGLCNIKETLSLKPSFEKIALCFHTLLVDPFRKFLYKPISKLSIWPTFLALKWR